MFIGVASLKEKGLPSRRSRHSPVDLSEFSDPHFASVKTGANARFSVDYSRDPVFTDVLRI